MRAACARWILISSIALPSVVYGCGSSEDPAPPATAGAAGRGGTAGSSGSGGSGGVSGSSGTNGASGTAGSGGGDSGGASDASVPAPEVTTDKGKVRGIVVDGVNAYLGIPFADTTGGQNRWKPPQPAPAWSSTLETTAFGKVCPQISPVTRMYDVASDENCLTINVWSKQLAPATKLPVMVWFYGGAFAFGSGGGAYDGAHLARTAGVVLVTLNYRLASLGFLAHPALTAESQTSGNYGLLDQIAALKWVKANIQNFGGDPANVTIFGESAGGRSAVLHLLAQQSHGLFHRAIIESGLPIMQGATRAAAEEQGVRWANERGCGGDAGSDAGDALACLRALPPSALIASAPSALPGGLFYQGSGSAFFQPIVDGVLITGQPETLLAAGNLAKVPVLHGSNTAEGALFHTGVFGDTPVADEAAYREALGRRFGTNANAIVAQYPVSGFATANEALTAVSSDAFFVCSTRKFARLLSAAQVPNYLYSFSGPLDPSVRPELSGKAFHSAEIPYVFGNAFILGTIPEAYKPLQTAVQGYWSRFAKAGDPNGAGAPAWPAYTTVQDQHLALGMTIAAGTGHNKAKCDFWDTIPILP